MIIQNDKQITKNFKWSEFIYSKTAEANHISNEFSSNRHKVYMLEVANLLQEIRDVYGKPIIVTSGYRCYALNKKVGGAYNSDHRYGCAVDFKGATKEETKELFDIIIDMIVDKKIKVRQLIDERNYSWIHLSINSQYNSYKENQIIHS